MAGTVAAISTVITMRPPYLSVQMPNGTRISEPVSTGVAVSRPNSVALRPSVVFSGMPKTPNIIHTMKHTVNAKVLTISTLQALAGSGVWEAGLWAILFAHLQIDGRTVGLQPGTEHPPARRPQRGRRTMQARGAIVLKNQPRP